MKELNWEKMQKQRMKLSKITFDPMFKEKFAEDCFKKAKFNNYEYGRKAVESLREILNNNFEVLEIGPGYGTLTIPLAKNVKKVIAVESSETTADYLKQNLEENRIGNVEVINKNWLEINDRKIKDRFDLVVCSHFLWQMKDIEKHLKRMENTSKKYCTVIQPAGRDSLVKETWKKITGKDYKGEFDPDADYFVYLILRQWGRLVNVRVMEYNIERDLEQEIRYIASFIGRYIEVDTHMKRDIEEYLIEKSKGKFFKETCFATVMWWKVPRYGKVGKEVIK